MEICLPTHPNHPSKTDLGCVSVSLCAYTGSENDSGMGILFERYCAGCFVPRTDWRVVEGRNPNRLVVKLHEESVYQLWMLSSWFLLISPN